MWKLLSGENEVVYGNIKYKFDLGPGSVSTLISYPYLPLLDYGTGSNFFSDWKDYPPEPEMKDEKYYGATIDEWAFDENLWIGLLYGGMGGGLIDMLVALDSDNYDDEDYDYSMFTEGRGTCRGPGMCCRPGFRGAAFA